MAAVASTSWTTIPASVLPVSSAAFLFFNFCFSRFLSSNESVPTNYLILYVFFYFFFQVSRAVAVRPMWTNVWPQ